MPENVATIESGAFYGCNGIITLTIPKGVTHISNNLLAKCTDLLAIVIPNTVTRIYSNAFDGCNSLCEIFFTGTEEEWKKITVDPNNNRISKAKVHFVTVSEGLEYKLNSTRNGYAVVGKGTFEGSELFIPNTYNGLPVTSIEFGAFEDCTELTSVFIPDTVRSLKGNVFKNCKKINKIVIPYTVRSMSATTFEGCSRIPGLFLGFDKPWWADEMSFYISVTYYVKPQ